MARKNKKRKSFPQSTTAVPTVDEKQKSKKKDAKRDGGGQAIRETVESLVVAFVLAFLFRTFQAEAFVIPTGSMAPTLMGRHKDVECSECGQRFKVNASTEASTVADLEARFGNGSAGELRSAATCVGGVCSACRYPMAFTDRLPSGVEHGDVAIKGQSSYSGDRILVNKYLYAFTEPERWDVVVFKFPGDANTNYIKRLVGLPNEDLQIYQGDVFVRPLGSDEPRQIARKSPSKVLAMRQLVYDTEKESATLQKAGWPPRWTSSDAAGWKVEGAVDGRRLTQTFSVDAPSGQTDWLRYHHRVPMTRAWQDAWRGTQINAELAEPTLITDYNAYNSEVVRRVALRDRGIWLAAKDYGLHWTGDLILEAEVEIAEGSGELLLDLVEAGRHFTCAIDLSTGKAVVTARAFETGEAIEGFSPTAQTSVRGPGRRRLRMANVDDQILLWVDDSLVAFDADTGYDVDAVFGGRRKIIPQHSEADAGDLAPAGIGARGASLTVTRLSLWRDIYYIADSWEERRGKVGIPVSDFDLNPTGGRIEVVDADGHSIPIADLVRNPQLWQSAFATRRHVDFETTDDQFFVMGDNSAASLDCRLWKSGKGGEPGGPYLERSLLIGKAVCVYWPHSWSRIPGTSIPFPLFPNFADMRLVR